MVRPVSRELRCNCTNITKLAQVQCQRVKDSLSKSLDNLVQIDDMGLQLLLIHFLRSQFTGILRERSSSTRSLWPRTKARGHTTDVLDKLTICLVVGLYHSNRVAGCSIHDSKNANMELVEEGVDLMYGVPLLLVLQSTQSNIDALEVPVEVLLDFGEAKRGINDRMARRRNSRTSLKRLRTNSDSELSTAL